MILEQDDSTRILRQKQYRQELYNSILQKYTLKSHNKNANKNIVQQQFQTKPTETFSLIKNIQDQQQRRKNKQKQYYHELERQRQQQIQLKKQRIQNQKQMQLEQDAKIERENQMLKKRYQQQKIRQHRKQEIINERTKQAQEQYYRKQQQKTEKKYKAKISNNNGKNNHNKQNFPEDSLDKISNKVQNIPNSNNVQEDYQNSRVKIDMPVTFAYPTRVQNQQFNFPQRRIISTNYYRQLQLEKRKFEQQTNQIRQLNRYLGSQVTNLPKRSHQGLQSLRQLQRMLDDQSNNLKIQYAKPYEKYRIGSRAKTQNQKVYSGFYDL